MKTRFAICLAAAACAAVWATAAFAQAMLPPHEIVASIRSTGLQPIGTPVRRGKRYIMRAVDGRGYQLRVAADAFTGRILGVRPIGYGHEFGYGTYRPGPPYPMEAIPPRGPYDRLAAPPPGAYERPPARIRSEPSVIYAPGSNAASQPSSRPPSAAKPSAKPAAPKVAAKPAKAPAPAAAETSATPAQPADSTTGATSPQAAENSPVAVPPVQSLE